MSQHDSDDLQHGELGSNESRSISLQERNKAAAAAKADEPVIRIPSTNEIVTVDCTKIPLNIRLTARMVVTFVGAGFETKLMIGDVITAVDGVEVVNRVHARLLLAKRKMIKLRIRRPTRTSTDERTFEDDIPPGYEKARGCETLVAYVCTAPGKKFGMNICKIDGRTYITKIDAESMLYETVAVSDAILAVEGKPPGDLIETRKMILRALDEKHFCRIVVERAVSQTAKSFLATCFFSYNRVPINPGMNDEAISIMNGHLRRLAHGEVPEPGPGILRLPADPNYVPSVRRQMSLSLSATQKPEKHVAVAGAYSYIPVTSDARTTKYLTPDGGALPRHGAPSH